jgi:hypothetical protein
MQALITHPSLQARLGGCLAAAAAGLRRLAAGWRHAWRTEEEKFLCGATGLEDLERRLKALERGRPAAMPGDGLPAHW